MEELHRKRKKQEAIASKIKVVGGVYDVVGGV